MLVYEFRNNNSFAIRYILRIYIVKSHNWKMNKQIGILE